MQDSLFVDSVDKETIQLKGGLLDYYPRWLGETDATALFEKFRLDVQWQQSTINMYGKPVKIPRLNAWYGDKGCRYSYSGHHFEPLVWLPELEFLRNRLQAELGEPFNSVLVNCYRNGQDSVAWHSDDEPELGQNPSVASVSLGASRCFHLRHRFDKGSTAQKLDLVSGSLLHMRGALQHHWQHQIPKTRKPVSERINLTFRYIIPG